MKILLNEGWQLQGCDRHSKADEAARSGQWSGEWLDAAVPGDVHSTLLRHGRIADPFYSTNVEKCRWIEDKVWWYRMEFSFDRPLADGAICELCFDGLDTFATVYLNDRELGSHENMFTPAVFDVTGRLRPGLNRLAVRFDSTIAATAGKDYEKMWYSYSPNRAWVRKAQMNFRWDWGPRLITAGIWRDVALNVYQTAKIDSVFAHTAALREDAADLQLEIAATVWRPEAGLHAEITLSRPGQRLTDTVALREGRAALRLTVPEPKLWWTHDLGEPALYDLTVLLKDGATMVDSYSTPIGIRTLTVQQRTEDGQKRFTFVLNGVPTFAKGANWIPAHSFIGAIGEDAYRQWIAIAKEGRMNMLRVWGGGIYEKEWFYRECDRQGIMVWQDFMFACSSYPDFDPEFMANVREEVRYAVTALRNHPSLAIWCGNNEIQWIHGQKLSDLQDLRLYGEKIYHDLMPELLAELDPTRLYWPSSPFGGNDPNSDDEGDKHNWQVWAGQVYPHRHGEKLVVDNTPAGISFKKFAQDYGKFVSEFGIHAAPVLRTLQECLPQEELYWGSFGLRYRNKDKRPNRGFLMMQSYTGLPSDLGQYIDYSMLAQAEGLKYGLEHYRRRKPECSGALIWQLNDCWPAISWSIVDFHGRPKASYYYVRRAFQPILLSFKEEGPDTVSLWAINDTLQEYRDRVEIGLADFFGNSEYREVLEIAVPANRSVKLREFSKNRINVTYTNFEFLYAQPGDAAAGGNLFFFEDYKDLNLPPCRLEVNRDRAVEDRLELRIRTDNFAKFVKIEHRLDGATLSDNYFDLRPGEEKIVTLQGLPGSLLRPEEIQVAALNQGS
ncbi:beta-mannosidase [Hydrogenispora ethanolica]|uniref:Beta-mannosidase n=1 Tax=Hydrogenispora ethanolica TaxID=1082276 RepID=A0A4R1R8G1_HYDET|nr:glycoside hydrolase family 2 protein [Hydrogenispora ethanolica]TCL61943.1 beta-mannosidase [Hydrogenispora ethanolica]